MLPDHARAKPLEVWYQDEARVGQQGTLTRVWAERGTRPRAPRDTRYVSAYIFGAICPARPARAETAVTAETAALVMPHANTEAPLGRLRRAESTPLA